MADYKIALHYGQSIVWNNLLRFNVMVHPRRWGKSDLLSFLAAKIGIDGGEVSYYAPGFERYIEPFQQTKINDRFGKAIKSSPVGKATFFKSGGIIRYFSSLDKDAGRGGAPHLVLIDEFGHDASKGSIQILYEQVIRPQAFDKQAIVVASGTPTGLTSYFYQLSTEHLRDDRFRTFNLPLQTNPKYTLSPWKEDLEREIATLPELVVQQEYFAKFVDWEQGSFYEWKRFVEVGDRHDWRTYKHLYLTLDTAMTSGVRSDSTAWGLFGLDWKGDNPNTSEIHLLDWGLEKIDANLLSHRFINMFDKFIEKYPNTNFTILIEDSTPAKQFIQDLQMQNYPVIAMGEDYLLYAGKKGRALATSPYVYSGFFKISTTAKEKRVALGDGEYRNHLKEQIIKFRPDKRNQQDDILDMLFYGIIYAVYNCEYGLRLDINTSFA